MRGRHFGFIGLLCATWAVVRVGIITLSTQGANTPRVRLVTTAYTAPPAESAGQMTVGLSPSEGPHIGRFKAIGIPVPKAEYRKAAARGGSPRFHFTSPLADVSTAPTPYSRERDGVALPVGITQIDRKTGRRRVEIYAYSFWHSGSATSGLLGNGQYGGSQSAVIAAYPLWYFRADDKAAKLSFVARAAAAHDDSTEREFAAGLRWRPSRQIPVQITAERRFRNARQDAFAIYVAGGKSGVALPLGFKLDTYGQAGFVSGTGGSAFADVSARADRQLVKAGKVRMAVGAGSWGGGQADVMRVDVGPTVRADVAVGPAQLRLTADWRFRVAGNARPGNGPAVTLSTSF